MPTQHDHLSTMSNYDDDEVVYHHPPARHLNQLPSTATIQQTVNSWKDYDSDRTNKKLWQQTFEDEAQRLQDIDFRVPTEAKDFAKLVYEYGHQEVVQKQVRENFAHFEQMEPNRWPKKDAIWAQAKIFLGQELVARHQLLPALHQFTLAVLKAPGDQPDLAKAYYHRAAVHVLLQSSRHALEDIDIALSMWPKTESNCELQKIRLKALIQLGRQAEADELLAQIDTFEKQRSEWKKLINEVNNLEEGFGIADENDDDTENDDDDDNAQQHHELPTKKLRIEEEPNPYTRYLSEPFQLDCCHNCMEYLRPPPMALPSALRPFSQSTNLHSCHHCIHVLFCSEVCRQSAWNAYHRYECRLYPIIARCDPMSDLHLAFRVLITTPLVVNVEYARLIQNSNHVLNIPEKHQKIAADYGRIAAIEFDVTQMEECQHPFLIGSAIFVEILKRNGYLDQMDQDMPECNKEKDGKQILAALGGTFYRLMWQVHGKGEWKVTSMEKGGPVEKTGLLFDISSL